MPTLPQVFVVDDDRSVRVAFGRLLRASGFGVRLYSAPSELLDSGDRKAPDLLLIDVYLPEMNGFDLAARLCERWPEAPVIFVSGRSDAFSRFRLETADAAACLVKPCDDDRLIAAVKGAIEGAGGSHRLTSAGTPDRPGPDLR